MQYEAYIDDSGVAQGEFGLLAGWFAPAKAWAEFKADWQAMLDRPPAIEYLKLRELRAARGPFSRAKMTDEERVDREYQAMAIIAQHKLLPFTCTVECSEFDELIKDAGRKLYITQYQLLFYVMSMQLADYLYSKGIRATVDFICDEQMTQQRDIEDTWETMRQVAPARLRRRLGKRPLFAPDTVEIPIQAADALAWFFRRQMMRTLEKKPLEPDPWHIPKGFTPHVSKFGFGVVVVGAYLKQAVSEISEMIETERRHQGRIV